MNIVVVFKLMPDEEHLSEYQDADVMSASDSDILTEALHLRDAIPGSKVSVVVMGPPIGEKILRKARTMDIDDAFLVCDESFRGLGIRDSARVMAGALKSLNCDLILFGRQAIDGDAAHFATLVAHDTGLPHILYSKAITSDGKTVKALKQTPDEEYNVTCALPAVVMSAREIQKPRYPSIADILGAYSDAFEMETIDAAGAGIGAETLGSFSQATELIETYEPSGDKKCVFLEGADDAEKAEALMRTIARIGGRL